MLCNTSTYSILFCRELLLFKGIRYFLKHCVPLLAKTGLALIGWAWKGVAMTLDKPSQARFLQRLVHSTTWRFPGELQDADNKRKKSNTLGFLKGLESENSFILSFFFFIILTKFHVVIDIFLFKITSEYYT